MRRVIGVLVCCLATIAPGWASGYTPHQLTRLDTLVFATPLATFVQLTRRHGDADNVFDWSTDFCSAPLIGNSGRTFDFTSACRRHDFAYRNYKRADAVRSPRGSMWNATVRQRIDSLFRREMTDLCVTRPLGDRPSCLIWAEIFYRAVRVAGGP